VRVGEDHLLATFGCDVHAGGDQIEAAGAQARNQRAPFGQDRLDGFHAHAFEDVPDDLR